MPRRLINKTFLLFLFLSPGITNANIINVFFAGGQSNAKSEWVNGIKDALIASNKYENIVIVHQIHPGDWLHSWYSGNSSAKTNLQFIDDLQNPNPPD